MGCVFGKVSSSAVKDSEDSPKQRELLRKTSQLQAARANSSKRNGDVRRIGSVAKKGNNGSRIVRDESHESRESSISEVVSSLPGPISVPIAVEGEQVAAGWPSWLVTVAGEALDGWTPRKADTFEKLDKIGQGTYSSVYKGRDLLNNKFVALKKVCFDKMDPESVRFMAREILILRKLDHPNIIKLEGLVTSRTSSSLYLVFEYMEHDLTGLASLPGVKFTEPQVKCYMRQLLSGLDYCHSHGVLHRDIKGSNLLIDNNGVLKIADFGLASCFDSSKSIPLTSRVVTLWYRPPELLLGATRYGVAVDLWSTGCILGELYAGKPIMPGRTEVEQLHKIFKLCGSPSEEYWRTSKLPHSTVFKPIQPYRQRIAETYKDLPDVAVKLMGTLLSVDPSERGTAASALESEFFETKPLACDPSNLPRYPPSKEIDAKLREDEARRRVTVGVKGQKGECNLKKSNELRAAPAPEANAELATSMQRRQGNPNPKSQSEYFNSHKDEPASGFPIDPPRSSLTSKDHTLPDRVSYSGPLVPRMEPRALEPQDKLASSQVAARNQVTRLSESFGDPLRKQDRRSHTQIYSGAQQIGRVGITETFKDGHTRKEKNVNYSGPILVPSHNIEQVLKEHDRRIHEVARRLRHEKKKGGRLWPQGMQLKSNTVGISNQSIG